MKTIAIIVAGGSGTRFGANRPKQFLDLLGKPVLMRTLEAVDLALNDVEHEILVTLPEHEVANWHELCGQRGFAIAHRVVSGGDTRWRSVKNALDTLAGVGDGDVIAVHDGVRPMASPQLIGRCVATARQCGSAVPVVTLNDSVRQVVGGTSRALDRSSLRAVQTPQAFAARLLIDAYAQPYRPAFTDDASVVESMGRHITLVEGEPDNIKITRPVDLAMAEYLLNSHA